MNSIPIITALQDVRGLNSLEEKIVCVRLLKRKRIQNSRLSDKTAVPFFSFFLAQPAQDKKDRNHSSLMNRKKSFCFVF